MRLKHKSPIYYPIFRQYRIKTDVKDLVITPAPSSIVLLYRSSSKLPRTIWTCSYHVKNRGWPGWYNTLKTKFKGNIPYYRSKKHCHISCKDIGCTCDKYAVKYNTSKNIKQRNNQNLIQKYESCTHYL